MKRKYWIVTLILSVFVTIGATSFNYQPKPDGGYENLKVLPKDITEEKLDSTMDAFKASLGVKCGFCHARNDQTQKLDFASDAKEEKNTARDMLRMTAYINATYMNDDKSTKTDTIRKVICYTCHRGANEPERKALLTRVDSLAHLPPPPKK